MGAATASRRVTKRSATARVSFVPLHISFPKALRPASIDWRCGHKTPRHLPRHVGKAAAALVLMMTLPVDGSPATITARELTWALYTGATGMKAHCIPGQRASPSVHAHCAHASPPPQTIHPIRPTHQATSHPYCTVPYANSPTGCRLRFSCAQICVHAAPSDPNGRSDTVRYSTPS